MALIETTMAPLFQELSDGICAADSQGRILYLNRAAERLLGVPMSRAVGGSLCELLCGRLNSPGGECASRCPLRDPDGERKSVTFTGRYSQETYFRWQDAGIRRAEKRKDIRVMCLRMPGELDSSGKQEHFVVIEDVSAEMELERQREDWRSMIAHDLRVPLTNIFGALRSLQDDGPLPEDLKEMVDIGARSCTRMMEMIDLYLDVARFDAGLMPIRLSVVELAPLLRRCVDEQGPLVRQKRIEVSLEIPSGLRAQADPELLCRAVHNVLNNALKFAPPEGRVAVAAEPASPTSVRLTIRDSGPGVPFEEIPKLFDRYQQAQTRRRGKGGGTGLGLAFCRQALEAMGGAISADSPPPPGWGASFTLLLSRPAPAQ